MKELLNQDDMSSLKSKVKDRKNHMKHLDRSLESDVFSSSYLFSDDEEEEKEKKEKRVCWITRLKNKK
ncbi:hypothetical protein CSUI_011260 [Cystoisospora suis]|uniref:Uncharacterized protein n=1 Tax=Cystoisospora suis TaxID=483139 RepID=A0A2C6KBY1_9APIC|nr:hypothetical protein CSUI_011260 [Cystoisospora suis]